MKEYRSDMKMSYKSESKKDSGCIKEFKEDSYAMLENGGTKYSHNNPAELKEKADKLAKQL